MTNDWDGVWNVAVVFPDAEPVKDGRIVAIAESCYEIESVPAGMCVTLQDREAGREYQIYITLTSMMEIAKDAIRRLQVEAEGISTHDV